MKKVYLAAIIALALSGTANALILTPGGQLYSGNETGQAAIDLALIGYGIDPNTELYKDNVGGLEEGSFAMYYTTTYFNDPLDPKDAEITWDGPGKITDPDYLLVKDGNQEPAWYLFDINGWDGMETIYLNDFWPRQGAISHVTIYGGGGSNEVPEPTTMLLFGAGLAGLAGLRRKIGK